MNGFERTLPFLKPIEHLIIDDTISEAMSLARGDDPGEVMRCIAEYCGDHKHSGYAGTRSNKLRQKSSVKGVPRANDQEIPGGQSIPGAG